MTTIRVKITNPTLPEAMRIWFASSPMVKATPETTVVHLNKLAQRRGIPATYELATEAQYWDYRASLKK